MYVDTYRWPSGDEWTEPVTGLGADARANIEAYHAAGMAIYNLAQQRQGRGLQWRAGRSRRSLCAPANPV
jgi:hypothetical protein